MNATVKQYLGSLKEDITDLDLFCDDELTSVFCHYILTECIDVLEDVKHPEGKHNAIINNKISFLKDVLNECKSYNINQGYNPLEWLT
jgi:hypothetical protein